MSATLKINWSFSAKVDGGPQLSDSQPPVEVTAYDLLRQELPAPVAPATSTTADINFPSATAPQMVVIQASKYSADAKKRVVYQVDGKAPDRLMDGPHVFMGTGAAGYLGATTPKKLSFTNSMDEAVTIQVLVGRPS